MPAEEKTDDACRAIADVDQIAIRLQPRADPDAGRVQAGGVQIVVQANRIGRSRGGGKPDDAQQCDKDPAHHAYV